ncbi:mannitol-1-phosphate 5-dehydrogenase [Bacillus daqingensis]|uniref:Mannitol-1-phosphate 5-dehydrogenase n=1 Tax=Bacillus daqingensis TaxID=872396 RepID=A0ABV9NYK1_9BACI
MRALHFGGGNIGKGLIGYVLNQNGFLVEFVDVSDESIDRFNRNKRYIIEQLDDKKTTHILEPVAALHGLSQKEDVLTSIQEADIITTSVGVTNLEKLAPTLAEGLVRRLEQKGTTVDVMANENALHATALLKEAVKKHLSPEQFAAIAEKTGFPNVAIDRLSLTKADDQVEMVLVEPYFEWIVEQPAIVNDTTAQLEGVTYVEDLAPYIERKLFIVNMGHAATAYLGHLHHEPTIQHALKHPDIEETVRGAMTEVSRYLEAAYDMKPEELADYIDRTISRFKNDLIADDIYRVGRAPIRKLHAEERLVKPAKALADRGLSYTNLAKAIAAGYLFNPSEDEEALAIQAYIAETSMEEALEHFSQIEQPSFKKKVISFYETMAQTSW